MTIRRMYRGVLVLAVIVALAGCGRGGSAEAAADRAAAQQEQLDEALATVADLQAQVDELSDRLEEADERDAKMAKRLDTVTDRLWSSLAKVRDSVGDAEGAGADAAAHASSALDQAAVAIRDLAVLEERFDYHLRNSGD